MAKPPSAIQQHSVRQVLGTPRLIDQGTHSDPSSPLKGIQSIFYENPLKVNSLALKEAGLDGLDPPNWTGTKVMLNSSRFANGILLESAGNILLDMAFDPVKFPG